MLPILLSLSIPFSKATEDPQTPDPVAALAKGMPAGAQKILVEKATPPAAPLRLISFRDTGEQSGPKGKGYGVDPLRMSMVRLE
ncbi:MAG: hypothetical protein EBT18_09835, partial [Gammaproteobacteria bacterium]|nr:hypothetical protein [Gammaproteobacteria bacterium]